MCKRPDGSACTSGAMATGGTPTMVATVIVGRNNHHNYRLRRGGSTRAGTMADGDAGQPKNGDNGYRDKGSCRKFVASIRQI